MLCAVRAVTYNFVEKTGHVIMDEIGCVDMGGCIAVFTAIDPEVKAIQTWNEVDGEHFEDTAYVKHGEAWHPIRHSREVEDKKNAAIDAFFEKHTKKTADLTTPVLP
jgi:hypothetical protein